METVLTGRSSDGRFAQGNKSGPGNPYAQQAAAFRALLAKVVTEDDIMDVIKALIKRAKEGFFPAIKMVLEKFMGKGGDNGRDQGAGAGERNGCVPLAAVGLPVPSTPSTGSPTAAAPQSSVSSAKPGANTADELLRALINPPQPLFSGAQSAVAKMLLPTTNFNFGAPKTVKKAETRRLSR